MKQCTKYLLTMLLALLVYTGETRAESATCVCACKVDTVEHCALSQAGEKHKLLDDIYNHISNQSLFVKLSDTAQVPTCKFIRMLLAGLYALNTPAAGRGDSLSAIYQPTPGNPHKYYLYGLRKLLI